MGGKKYGYNGNKRGRYTSCAPCIKAGHNNCWVWTSKLSSKPNCPECKKPYPGRNKQHKEEDGKGKGTEGEDKFDKGILLEILKAMPEESRKKLPQEVQKLLEPGQKAETKPDQIGDLQKKEERLEKQIQATALKLQQWKESAAKKEEELTDQVVELQETKEKIKVLAIALSNPEEEEGGKTSGWDESNFHALDTEDKEKFQKLQTKILEQNRLAAETQQELEQFCANNKKKQSAVAPTPPPPGAAQATQPSAAAAPIAKPPDDNEVAAKEKAVAAAKEETARKAKRLLEDVSKKADEKLKAKQQKEQDARQQAQADIDKAAAEAAKAAAAGAEPMQTG